MEFPLIFYDFEVNSMDAICLFNDFNQMQRINNEQKTQNNVLAVHRGTPSRGTHRKGEII